MCSSRRDLSSCARGVGAMTAELGEAQHICSKAILKRKVPQFQRNQVGALRLWMRGIKQTMISAEVEAGTFEHAGYVLLVEI